MDPKAPWEHCWMREFFDRGEDYSDIFFINSLFGTENFFMDDIKK